MESTLQEGVLITPWIEWNSIDSHGSSFAAKLPPTGEI
jgi:hypothetical protein